jgi:cell wall-associated NlpC family hydrolase
MFESVKALSFRGEAPPQMKNFTAIAQSASFSLPDWVSAYVGLPFKEGGRNRDGLDCYGLLRLVINERFGGAVPEYEGIAYRPGEDSSLLAALMDERIRLWRPIAIGEEKPGDGVLLRVMGRPIHVGVVVEAGYMLHIEKNCDSVLERFSTGSRWEKRLLGFYRHAA